MRRAKAIIVLMLLSPVLAEMIPASSPPSAFFRPSLLLFYVLLGYGLPVLLIRDFAVRAQFGAAAIFALGCGYGIYNEGLLAKTITQSQGLPMAEYNNYGYFAGVSFPWLSVISQWQSLASVLLPIVFTHALFPDERAKPWLGKKLAVALAVLLLIVASLSLMDKERLGGTPSQLAALWGVMLLCALIARLCRHAGAVPHGAVPHRAVRQDAAFSWKPVLCGASVMYVFMFLAFVANLKIAPAIFILIVAFVTGSYLLIFSRCRWLDITSLTLFGIGFYSQFALLGMAVRLMQNLAAAESVVAGLLALAILFSCVLKIRKRASQDTTVKRFGALEAESHARRAFVRAPRS